MAILFVFFLGILLLMFVNFGSSMYNKQTLASMAFQLSEVAVLAFGMALCMLLGGIDLSIVANANLASLLAAMVLTGKFFDIEKAGQFVTILVAVIVAVCVGMVCGLINGLIISKFSVSPIVTTLSTMTLYSGLAMGITGGNSIGNYPPAFLKFGTGSIGPVPIVFLTACIVFIVLILALDRTKLGHEIHYIGENHTASRFTGINNENVIVKVYTIVDTLVPALETIQVASAEGKDFAAALDEMKDAAEKGMLSTKDMVAKYGRASRLGERSLGVQDAGSTSCCIILQAMADGMKSVME